MARAPHILVCDDDRETLKLVERFLRTYELQVSTAATGQDLLALFENWNIDLVVLDLMLPDLGGFDLCRRLRAKTSVPVIMLTAINDENDRILGLEIGADDYLTKPFNPRELLARVRAVLRRYQEADGKAAAAAAGVRQYRFGAWLLDLPNRELRTTSNVVVHLSSGEFALLSVFVGHPNRVLNREQLADLCQRQATLPFNRSVDIQVSRLRHKIEADPRNPALIKTVRGQGYIFTASVASGS